MSDHQQFYRLIFKTIKKHLPIATEEAHKLAVILQKAIDKEYLYMKSEEEDEWYKESVT
tara:strand:- start:5903 stop:6079 length:177 start_codon:yes stop_codon:yes gene_type:complete